MRNQLHGVGVLLMMGALAGCGNPQKDKAPARDQDSDWTPALQWKKAGVSATTLEISTICSVDSSA
jgi:predicted small lipoprotein YifL